MRGLVYTVKPDDPEALSWEFAEFPHHEPMAATERADIEAVCLADLRQRRTRWRAQLLRRRIVTDLRRHAPAVQLDDAASRSDEWRK